MEVKQLGNNTFHLVIDMSKEINQKMSLSNLEIHLEDDQGKESTFYLGVSTTAKVESIEQQESQEDEILEGIIEDTTLENLKKIPYNFEDLSKNDVVELIESYPFKGDEFHEVLGLILMTMEDQESGKIDEAGVQAAFLTLSPRYKELLKKVIASEYMKIPKLKIERVTEYGELELKFDRDIIIPKNLAYFDFSKILALTLVNEE